MKQCPNCRNQIPEEAAYCPVCGTTVDASHVFPEPYHTQGPVTNAVPTYVPPVPVKNPYDHSDEYCDAEIAGNKLVCMLIYLLDFVGIIIALLHSGDFAYTRFHIHQGMKFCVVETLLVFFSLAFCWTFIVPIVGVIALIAILVVKFISFVQVCKGKAVEPAIIRSIKFLK